MTAPSVVAAGGSAWPERHRQVADRPLVSTVPLVGLPALQDVAVGGDQPAAGVEVEGAGPGVELLVARLGHEEAVAADHEVGGPAGALGRALAEVGRDRGDLAPRGRPGPGWCRRSSAVGAEPLRSTCDSVSSKTVVLLLKPTVLTLAMLLPTTSILVWWAWRPEMAGEQGTKHGETPRVGVGGGDGGVGATAAVAAGQGGRQADLGDAADVDASRRRSPRWLVLVAGEIWTAVTTPVCVAPSVVGVGRPCWPTSAPARERPLQGQRAGCSGRRSSAASATWVRWPSAPSCSLLLVGLLGSWYFIWATSSLRKVSVPIWSARSTRRAWPTDVAMDDGAAHWVGHREVLSGSDADVHAGRRGSGGGRGLAGCLRVSAVRDHGRPRPSAPVRLAAVLVGRLLLGCLLLGRLVLGGPRARRCRGRRRAASSERPAASRSRRRSGQRVEQGGPAVLVGAAQGQVDRAVERGSPGRAPGPRLSGVQDQGHRVRRRPARWLSTTTCAATWAATGAGGAGAVVAATGATAAAGATAGGATTAADRSGTATSAGPARRCPRCPTTRSPR